MAFSFNSFVRGGVLDDEFAEIYHSAGFPSDKQRARGPFVMYLLSEKGYTYEQIKGLDDGTFTIDEEERYKLFDDFKKELADHPVCKRGEDNIYQMTSDAAENGAIYGRWLKNAMNKMKDQMIPPLGNANTPAEVYEFLNNCHELKAYVKDIVQEYATLWKSPETSGPVLEAMGEEAMGFFGIVENVHNIFGAFNDLFKGAQSDKAKAVYYPYFKEFTDLVAGKKFSELDIEKLTEMNYSMLFTSPNIQAFAEDPEKNDPKYTDFLNTGVAEFDADNITFKSPLSQKQVTLKENLEETKDIVNDGMADILRTSDKNYLEYLPFEQIYARFRAVPENPEYKENVTEEEKAAVHKLFIDTAGNLHNYYSNTLNYAAGKKFTDLIKINGVMLTAIIEDKYADKNLSDEQKKTALEYEFVAALTDESKNIEYVPYAVSKDDRKIVPGEPVKIPHFERELVRTYDDSVNVLMDDNANKKYGKSLYEILSNAENTYNLLYDGSGITDSSEFKKMLGSFKELHELYETIEASGLRRGNKIGEDVFNHLAAEHGYTKEMVSDLLKETAKNASDYITAKNASGKYRKTEKGNDRLMCAAGFISDLDQELTVRKHPDIKLKDSAGEKTERMFSSGSDRKKISFKNLMEEGNKKRKDTVAIENNDARNNKKRMHERAMR